jgi:hypothetical protein
MTEYEPVDRCEGMKGLSAGREGSLIELITFVVSDVRKTSQAVSA